MAIEKFKRGIDGTVLFMVSSFPIHTAPTLLAKDQDLKYCSIKLFPGKPGHSSTNTWEEHNLQYQFLHMIVMTDFYTYFAFEKTKSICVQINK